jgi:hypothetical protein
MIPIQIPLYPAALRVYRGHRIRVRVVSSSAGFGGGRSVLRSFIAFVEKMSSLWGRES